MQSSINTNRFLNDLEKVAKTRQEIADRLGNIADTLDRSELEGDSTSGKLGLERDIEDLTLASQNLRQGVFRLLVLGDLKRGKSTFLNALIGEKLLPSDVNPCTALLTVLRYGTQKKVTVYFKNGKPSKQLDFETFKQEYTIDPNEAKKLEQEQKAAFPDVDCAVVEYPLPLLEKGIEIVDSPGLNDTEARNQLSLNYINNCHAILFVFRAGQPCTLEERRYLDSYIKGRGLSVFFLINAWDEIRKGLIDPDDPEELEEAEAKLRQVFRTNLAEYCQVDGQNIYEERVFELSSLIALRRRIKNAEDTLEGTGFPKFLQSLNTFLTQERAIAEFRQARTLARQAYNDIHESIERRIPLLEQDVSELREKINSVEPEFQQLNEIRDRFQEEIQTTRNRKVKSISNSLHEYILNLENTFEKDFTQYQPDLGFIDFLSQGKRQEFNIAFKNAFERYLTEKMSAWEFSAEKEIKEAFSQLAKSAIDYGTTYSKIADTINEKLIGKKLYFSTNLDEDGSPGWSKWAMGVFLLSLGNVGGVALAIAGFDWKNIFINWLAVIGIYRILVIISGIFINPIGVVLLSLGVGAVQVAQIRQEFVKSIKKEFVKSLPQIAREQSESVAEAVKDCFANYEREAIKRINDDIKSRKAELENLLQQKESGEIDRANEIKRLRDLDAKVLNDRDRIESAYENLVSFF